jgi:hypothetical protein
MEKNEKNKIDAAIDEVLESKRLKQGSKFLFKSAAGLALLVFIIFIVGIMTGGIR